MANFRDPLPEMLISTDSRRVSVDDHKAFREALTDRSAALDEIDAELDDMLQVDPFNGDPPSRRKDREISRVLSLLDSLEERGTL